jgi:hypothetical protein
VSDPQMTRAVMNLRSDPTANALMAGAFTKANSEKLVGRLGRNPTEGEVYIAHFLGSNGAGRLIGLAASSPQTSAASAFPGAARANPTIFYNGRGNARSVSDVYRLLVGRYDVARRAPESSVATADASGSMGPQSAFLPETASPTDAPVAGRPPKPHVIDATPVFHGLFRSNAGPEPVAPLVSSLWTAPRRPDGAKAPAAAVAAKPASEPVAGDLGLFQDQAPDARALFRGRVEHI